MSTGVECECEQDGSACPDRPRSGGGSRCRCAARPSAGRGPPGPGAAPPAGSLRAPCTGPSGAAPTSDHAAARTRCGLCPRLLRGPSCGPPSLLQPGAGGRAELCDNPHFRVLTPRKKIAITRCFPGNIRFAHAARSAVRAAGRGLPGCAEGQRGAPSPTGHGACPTPGGVHARPGRQGKQRSPGPVPAPAVPRVAVAVPSASPRGHTSLSEAEQRAARRFWQPRPHAAAAAGSPRSLADSGGEHLARGRLLGGGGARPRTSREPRCPGRAAAQSQGPRPVSFMPCGHAPGARHMLSQRPGWWRGPPRTAGPPCG